MHPFYPAPEPFVNKKIEISQVKFLSIVYYA
jgi:hypothetical protein